MPAENQHRFHICQSCHKMVEKVYQKGYCRECLVQYFAQVRPVIDNAHAIAEAQSSNRESAGSEKNLS